MTRLSARGFCSSVRKAAAGAMLVLYTAAAGAAQQPAPPLPLSPETAVSLALANNLRLESARQNAHAADFNVQAAESAWAPFIATTLGQGRAQNPAGTSLDQALGVLTDRQTALDVSLGQRLPWGGSYDVGWSSLRRSTNSLLSRFQPELTAAVTARFTQPLLRGFAIDRPRADRARSIQARDRVDFELDGRVAALKREVLYAYWQWVYARDLSGVSREALALARALLDGNRERVAARAMAATDVIEAEAEVARRDEAVIVAAKNVANAEDRLRLLILNLRSLEYSTPLEPTDPAEFQSVVGRPDPVGRALEERSDIRILKSAIETNTVNVRHLRNEALPDVNLSLGFSARALGGTELIRDGGLGTPVSGAVPGGFGGVLGDLGRLRYPGWSMQLALQYPLGNTAAKAQAGGAQTEKRQNELSLEALEQQVTTEVRTALREVETNEKRLQSTGTAVALAERRLAAEEEKFLVGLSTSFFVFQAQRDLASARVARLGAVLDHRLSLADLEAVQLAPLTPIR